MLSEGMVNEMKCNYSSKQNTVTTALRQSIYCGTYISGGRLPVQTELMHQFKVSSATIQKALGQLEREGFIEKRQKSGTHVVEQPPHVRNIGMVFPFDPMSGAYYSKFYRTISQAADLYQRKNDRPILQFHGVNGREYVPERQRLMDLLLTHRLSGIVFVGPGFEFEGTAILEDPGVSRVAVGSMPKYPGIPVVSFDALSFLEKAFDHLLDQGRDRIAILSPYLDKTGEAELSRVISARNLYCPTHWRLQLCQAEPRCAQSCSRLLMADPANRPNGLIIADDNFTEHAVAGLFEAGVKVPDDVEVVEHCNFPCPAGMISSMRLGFHADQLVEKCIALIDKQRSGEEVEPLTVLPAMFN